MPFLLVAPGLERSARAMTFLRRHRLVISRLRGAMLVLIGVALATDLWTAWTQSPHRLIGTIQTAV